jgi:Tol biopolymer transport system component
LTRWNKNVSELNPSWSPDGKHIAFFGVSANGVYDLYISTLAGQVKLLAKDIVKGDQFGPAWSPDGKQLFYVQRLEQNRDQIFAVNPSTGAKKPIVTNTHLNSELSVTKRDGNWLLAFTSQGEEKTEGLVYRKLYVKTLKPF